MSEFLKPIYHYDISGTIAAGTGDKIGETNPNLQYRSPLTIQQTGERALTAAFSHALNSDKGTIEPAPVAKPKSKRRKKGYLDTIYS